MRINLSRFKKTKEDNDRTTLEDDRGHTITLSKKALRPHILKQLTDLPVHMKDGGEVEDAGNQVSPKESTQPMGFHQEPYKGTWLESLQNGYDYMKDAYNSAQQREQQYFSPGVMAPPQAPPPQAQPQQMMPQDAQQMPMPQQSAQVPAQVPQGQKMADPYNMYMQGMNQQVQAQQQEAQAAGEMGKQQAKIYEDFANSRRDEMMKYQSHLDDLNSERQKLLADYKNGTINPKHFTENLSSGQKVAMTIGILLSGIGSGVTGKENMAMDFLNKQIDRDIQSQRDRLGKTESLLSANLKEFGNLHDAMTMTRINMQDMMADKIAQAAATSAYPMAQAKAQAAIGALHANTAQALPGLATSRMQMQYLNNPTNQQMTDPASQIRRLQMIKMISPEQGEKAYKALGESEHLDKLRNNALAAFDKASQLNTLANRVKNPIQAKKQIDALIAPIIAGASKETAGRFTEQDSAMLEHLLHPDFTANDETRKLQRNRINQLFLERANFPELDALGIKHGSGGRFNPSGESRFQEGKAVKPK